MTARKKVLPSLITFELVGSRQDVAESPSSLEVQETLHLEAHKTFTELLRSAVILVKAEEV